VAEQHDETEPSQGSGNNEPETEGLANTEAEASVEADASADEPVVAKPKKKKKRAVAIDPNEPIRDRNRRLREEAAAKRRGADERRAGAAPVRNLEAGEIVDDALARSTQAAGEWLKKNFNVVQWFILAGIVAWVGYAIYSYRAGRASEAASAKLGEAIRAENARIGASDDTKPDPRSGLEDTRAAYATDEARDKAAELAYRDVANAKSSGAAATLAKLGLASVLYDQRKFADAKAAYQAVKDSPLAAQDQDVKGRALEGIGMSAEGLDDKAGAAKAFGELANIDALGFGALGAYHQARLAYAAGDTEKAKTLLADAQKKLDSGDSKKSLGAPGYLQHTVRELMRRVDPSAVTASPNALTADQLQQLQEQMAGGDGQGPGKGMSSEKLNELLKQMSKGKAPAAPAPPASAP